MQPSVAQRSAFSPIRNGRVFEEVVDRIREAIFSGRFAPGERLPTERELASLFRVSRTGIREALRVLELSGVLEVRHGGGGGVFVAEHPPRPVSLALHTLLKHEHVTLPDLYRAKIFFEERMAEEVARHATEHDLAALAMNLEQTEQVLQRGERPLQETVEFHLLMVRALRNPVLEEILNALADVAARMEQMQPGDERFYRATLLEHRQIFEALRARQPGKAARAMVFHLKTVETLLLKGQEWRATTHDRTRG